MSNLQANLTSELEIILNNRELELRNTITGRNLELANDMYNEMIELGLIKKRGYTLRGIEDTHLYNIKFVQ